MKLTEILLYVSKIIFSLLVVSATRGRDAWIFMKFYFKFYNCPGTARSHAYKHTKLVHMDAHAAVRRGGGCVRGRATRRLPLQVKVLLY